MGFTLVRVLMSGCSSNSGLIFTSLRVLNTPTGSTSGSTSWGQSLRLVALVLAPSYPVLEILYRCPPHQPSPCLAPGLVLFPNVLSSSFSPLSGLIQWTLPPMVIPAPRVFFCLYVLHFVQYSPVVALITRLCFSGGGPGHKTLFLQW